MQLANYPNLRGCIFIVTYGRSGSTLLQSLLQTIPGSHIVGENYNIIEGLFNASQRARRARNKWGNKPHPKNHPWHGASDVDPDRFEQRLMEVFAEEIINAPADARWLGMKEIRYRAFGDRFPLVMEYYRRNFPNAFVVFNSRAADSVAQSKWWAKREIDEVREMVSEMDTRFAEFADANPDWAHHVQYEDVVADPTSLQPLFDKLGEPLNLERAQSVLGEKLEH